MKLKPLEGQIENTILEYLSYFKNGFVTKIAPSGFFDGARMRKHRSPFFRTGMSDIFFWYNSKFYAFEVKTEQEYKYVMKRYLWLIETPYLLLNKKQQHLKDQVLFIEHIKKSGHHASFVHCVDQVKTILENKNKVDFGHG